MDVGSASGPDDHVGRDLAKVDWASTPLGPSADWPQSLRTAVSILLSSRFAMWMAWGPELTFFCNDAYRRATWAASTRGHSAGLPARCGPRSGATSVRVSTGS